MTEEFELPVQVRDLPRARVARVAYTGPAAAIGDALERAQSFAVRHGVGPCGPAEASFEAIAPPGEDVRATVSVPLTRLPEDGDGVELLRLPRRRAACLLFTGPLGPRFRAMHLELFAWMDQRGLPRAGTAHEHAYIANDEQGWTIEIRVPIVGGAAPVAPLL
jgi:effector-binding domain-containing protein